jgi:hypothetical protein
MRMHVLAIIGVLGCAAGAMAQGADGGLPPKEIGNRANGYDYQPTPSEVAPREKAAGVLPSADQQRAEDQDLARLDQGLLQSEGLSTKSVPKLTNDK